MKRITALIIVLCLIVSFCLFQNRSDAYATDIGLSMISAMSYSLMNYWGVNFQSASATTAGMQGFMNDRLGLYVNETGSSLIELFGAEAARISLGKLIIPYQMYNGIKSFYTWLSDKYGIGDSDTYLSQGQYNGLYLPIDDIGDTSIPASGYGCSFSGETPITSEYPYSGYAYLNVYNNGVKKFSNLTPGTNNFWNGEYYYYIDGTSLYTRAFTSSRKTNNPVGSGRYYVAEVSNVTDKILWNGSDYVEPTVLNPDKEWSGTIDGQAILDTNLDQLLQDIFEAVADNNLDVDGEIIDVPSPPSPAPTPVIDVIDGINTQIGQLDGLGNDIGNIADNLDDLGALQEEAVDALEGIQEGIDTQTGILGGINTKAGSIDQTLTDTQDIVNDISDTLTDALDVPSAQESSDYKFDLSTLFPFCIPFDIARMLRAFDGVAAAPHFQIPIVISSIGFSYTMDLDFQIFDPVAAVLRQVELIAFAIALAYATSKVIRW